MSVNDLSPALAAAQAHVLRHSVTVEVVEEMDEDLTVPSGTVDEILAWAGDDPARREAALEAEQAGKNRVSLVKALS